MRTVDVPVFYEDGSVHFTQVLTEKEVQVLLQFALNFLVASGLSVHTFVNGAAEESTDDSTRGYTGLPS